MSDDNQNGNHLFVIMVVLSLVVTVLLLAFDRVKT